MVDSNVFERFTQDFSCGGEAFDKNSVMIYEIPKRWTKNGFSSKLNTTISPGDRGCLLKNYYTT